MDPHEAISPRVEFFLDLTCIHSYIGFTRFERAAKRYRAGGGEVTVVFRPFEVAPNAATAGEPLSAVHRRHFGENASTLVSKMAAVGVQEGLRLNFVDAVHVKTFEAHRLLATAVSQGLGEPMAERLFRAYLTDGLNIGDRATLATLAAEMGVKKPMTGDAELHAELENVRQLGVRSVPLVSFDGGPNLSGSQSENVYWEALARPSSRS